ncbi:hypothetical protein K402DRAFT_416225 [Aulographum hederae CBS 113979]|uniref:Uncharacterized protein n=1 Tax=Aulographum hederae CBS 113979 TaxID=1176131 RepID=A0A6G1HI11_9PEZI|nr:hypothetical protein K402DRAFT_416225 [Aulographum hederae CBS 113979]
MESPSELERFAQDFTLMLDRGSLNFQTCLATKAGNDPLLGLAIKILRKRRVASFENFLANTTIKPRTGTVPSLLGSCSEKKLYTIYEENRIGWTLPLRLVCFPRRQDGGLIFRVDVHIQGRRMELSKWLDTKNKAPDTFDPRRVGEYGYEKQWRWWCSNEKHFRILDLPQELRDILLLHIVGERVYPKFWNKDGGMNVSLTRGEITPKTKLTDYSLWDVIHKPNTSVLLLNKKITKDAMNVLYEDTSKVFRSHLELDMCTPEILFNSITGLRMRLRAIELEFDYAMYYEFFSMDVSIYSGRTNNSAFNTASRLKTFTGLKDLTIRFMGSNVGKHYDPWYDPWDDESEPVACLKVLVDWILSYAFRHIKQIPHVYLEGCIKDSVRAKWEPALKDYQRYGTEPKIDLSAIRKLPDDNFPPKCKCTTSCVFISAVPNDKKQAKPCDGYIFDPKD